jgi:hypothetical protein
MFHCLKEMRCFRWFVRSLPPTSILRRVSPEPKSEAGRKERADDQRLAINQEGPVSVL